MIEPEKRYTDEECDKLFAVLFPNGFAGEDVLAEVAPEGWAQSALYLAFHPTVDQVHWERIQLHRNLQEWPLRDKDRPKQPEPTFQETAAQYKDSVIEIEREAGLLIGLCLWDVFSNEHDVIDEDGRLVHLGSWRGAGRFIAERLNQQIAQKEYDYLDFYMGTIWVSQRTDLTPVYETIFRRLKQRCLDWRYQFPETRLVDLGSDRPDTARSAQIKKMRGELKKIHRAAIEDARQQPVPPIVIAYQNVYGRFPHGWPPWAFSGP
jgi:hypothetical protein